MKLDYYAPTSPQDALRQLRETSGKAVLIAGGTDLIPALRKGSSDIDLVIDLGSLHLHQISIEDGMIKLQAGVTHTQIIESPVVQAHLPILAQACREIGGPPVRNRGTLGGNLANASPAADTAPPLLAYDAELVLASSSGLRKIALKDFFLGPRKTILNNGEMILEVHVPFPEQHTAACFIKLGKRNAMAIAVVSVAARLTLDESGCVKQARIALGSVAPSPIRAISAEKILEGQALQADLIREAATLAVQAASPISDVRASAAYRSRMVEVLTRRALSAAWSDFQQER